MKSSIQEAIQDAIESIAYWEQQKTWWGSNGGNMAIEGIDNAELAIRQQREFIAEMVAIYS